MAVLFLVCAMSFGSPGCGGVTCLAAQTYLLMKNEGGTKREEGKDYGISAILQQFWEIPFCHSPSLSQWSSLLPSPGHFLAIPSLPQRRSMVQKSEANFYSHELMCGML